MNETKIFEVDANVDHLKLINNYIEDQLSKIGIPMKIIYSVKVAFEEIFVNICLYAYENSEDGEIKVVIKITDNKIEITLEDSGTPYNPLAKEDPDINAPIEERGIGGLGIFMAKKILDIFEYDFKNGKNINYLVKNF